MSDTAELAKGATEKRPYEPPKLTYFGTVRNMTGGSSGFNIDAFCGGANNGFQDCFM